MPVLQTMSSTTADTAAQLLYPPNVQFNASRIYTVKFLASCFAGAVAGVLGLENWLGFALFIFSTCLTSACLYVKCKGRPSKYAPGGIFELVNPGQENMFSFLLVWTLFYGALTQSIRKKMILSCPYHHVSSHRHCAWYGSALMLKAFRC